MSYEADLGFLRETFEKCHISTAVLYPDEGEGEFPDLGLETKDRPDVWSLFRAQVPALRQRTVYRYTDPFRFRYLIIRLPEDQTLAVCVVGPYQSDRLSNTEILELAEALGADAAATRGLETLHGNVPLLPDNSHLWAVLDTFCNRVWGELYSVVEVNDDSDVSLLRVGAQANPASWDMELMEKRYSFENQIMDAVSKGQTHKTEMLIAGLEANSFEQRHNDPLRNMKNYGIIMNTLLRKAAEKGGVHPVYLDQLSSAFARKIEFLPSLSGAQSLMGEMFREYCRLVKNHAGNHYSPPVVRAIAFIDSDLSAHLTLSTVAAHQKISPAYLSNLFKQETGETLTNHITRKRIRLAKDLLRSTKLQIQTIAQHCGVMDVHYFSKLFKRETGKSPAEYRRTH